MTFCFLISIVGMFLLSSTASNNVPSNSSMFHAVIQRHCVCCDIKGSVQILHILHLKPFMLVSCTLISSNRMFLCLHDILFFKYGSYWWFILMLFG
jgi:hypothetical protein